MLRVGALTVAACLVLLPAALDAQQVLRVRGNELTTVASRRPPRSVIDTRTLAGELPATAFASVLRASVAGVPTAAPVALASGGVLLTTANPARVLWVSAQAQIEREATLQDRAEGELSLGDDDALRFVSVNQSVSIAPTDGTARVLYPLPGAATTGVHSGRDGALLVVATPTINNAQAILLSPRGELLAARALPGQLVGRPQFSNDGCFWVATTTQLSCLDDRLRVQRLVRQRTSSIFSAGATTLGVLVENDLQIYEAGAQRTTVNVGPGVGWVAPIRDGFAVLHTASSYELWLVANDGNVRARITGPDAWVDGPINDRTGAMLLVSRAGAVVVFERDGTTRWRMELREPVARAPAALRDGSIAIATSTGNLLILR